MVGKKADKATLEFGSRAFELGFKKGMLFASNLPSNKFIFRADGRIEWQCEHGVGHTVWAPAGYRKMTGKYWNSHGCCGSECCPRITVR